MRSWDLTQAGHDQAVALCDDSCSVSWKELRSLVTAGGKTLESDTKQLVAIYRPRTLMGIVGYLSALSVGHAVILVDNKPEESVDDLFLRLQPDILLGLDVSTPPEFGIVENSDVVGVYARRKVASRAIPINSELALVARTSGSMADSKLVRLSFRNLSANAASIATATDIAKSHVVASSLRADFSFGLSLINSHLGVGAAVSLSDVSPTAPRFWTAAARNNVTTVGLVPSSVRYLSEGHDWSNSLPSLLSVLVAGGALDASGLRRLRRQVFPASVYYMYGQTEATARITCLSPLDAGEHEGAVGSVIPDGNIEILDNNLRDGVSGVGEIVYRGPNVMLGYARGEEDLSLGDTTQGVLHTGDLGYLRDGRLYLEGRLDRQVKVLGHRVNLDAVELRASAEIKGKPVAAVLVAPDAVELYVVGEKADLETLRKGGASAVGLPTGSMRLSIVDEFPFTHSGKVRYGQLGL